MAMTLLTAREQEIASLASTGLSNKGIARRLELSEGTVKVHLHNIFQKTGVRNRTALVALIGRKVLYSMHPVKHQGWKFP